MAGQQPLLQPATCCNWPPPMFPGAACVHASLNCSHSHRVFSAAFSMCRCLYIAGWSARQGTACVQAFAVVGAFVGGWLARQRRLEVERMNRKLRRINRQLRERKEQVRSHDRAASGALTGCGASLVSCGSESAGEVLPAGSSLQASCWQAAACHLSAAAAPGVSQSMHSSAFMWGTARLSVLFVGVHIASLGFGPTAGRRLHICLRFQDFAVRSRSAQQAVLSGFASTLQEEELVCVATDEEAIKAYRAALQTALDGPSAAHPTEGFGDDDLSLSQARHRAVRQGSVAGHASCYLSCAVHRGLYDVQLIAVAWQLHMQQCLWGRSGAWHW